MARVSPQCLQRSASIYEPIQQSDLQLDSQTLWEKLDRHYCMAKSTILCHQSSTTGLFPSRSGGDWHLAKVRDSLYCAASIWALSLAYRRLDDDKGRTHELEHSAIKCVRGVLYCYMRQADKVEQFKRHPSPTKCLHSVFDAHTGDAVLDYKDYGHLQIDALSLFLLFLVEMIASDLQIIYNTDEVRRVFRSLDFYLHSSVSHSLHISSFFIFHFFLFIINSKNVFFVFTNFLLQVAFVQNLVFCVERAYRVPDFGMWERGSKYNNGNVELHSSSIGLAKAALEAINGFNLFGNQGCSWSVIFVDLDAHVRNRQTLSFLLPRESRSHNTDAALLPCVGYPAFAIDDEALCAQTREKILRKLRGGYGFRRFLRDGYRTALEDRARRNYRPAEIKLFDGIECEFPLFYINMIIDGVFRDLPDQVKEYQDLLQPLLFATETGHPVVPKYFHVPFDFVEEERANPGSQCRYPSNTGVDGRLFLWGQALFLTAQLLVEKLITPREVDQAWRWIPPEERRNVSMRYSNQGPIENDIVVHVTLIAESQQLQSFLNTYGISTQTPLQLEPIQIWPQHELVKAYKYLGVNEKLKLSGRPDRPIGCIGTSKIYRIMGKTVVSYPLLFDLSDFYMSQDVMLLIDDIKNALKFIKQNWKMRGRPIFIVLIREDNIRGSRFNPMLDMLALFKKGVVGDVKVRVDRLQTMVSGAVVEQLDFLRISDDEPVPQFHSFGELEAPKGLRMRRQASTPAASDGEMHESSIVLEEWEHRSSLEILRQLRDEICICNQALLLGILLKKEGGSYITGEGTVESSLQRIYRVAGSRKQWSVVRLTASLLTKLVDSLAPSITNVLVQNKQVTLGLIGHDEVVITNPLSPVEILHLLYASSRTPEPRDAVLQQELVIHVGTLISTAPQLFRGMLKIRIGWIIHAMKHELALRAADVEKDGEKDRAAPNPSSSNLYDLSPSEVKQLLLDVLQPQQQARSWQNRRHMDGSLNRAPPGFYDRVWQVLERTPGGIIVSGSHLPQQPTLSDMTMYEMNFSLLVEDMLQSIEQPEYRQIVVELLMVVSLLLERNPEVDFQNAVDLDILVGDAMHSFRSEQGVSNNTATTNSEDMTEFYNTTPSGIHGTSSYLARAAVNTLLQGEVRPCMDGETCMVC
uniref:Phosphorylase b kinase regulatory subunit n=1 Tax=Eptatretus burgeri TaxID=7764 RepID=A0A8C4Q9C7_EPTBU